MVVAMHEPTLIFRRTRPAAPSGSWTLRSPARDVCSCSYFPHHRLYLTASGMYIPNVTEAAAAADSLKVPAAAPKPVSYSAEQLVHLMDPAHLRAACSSITYALLDKLQTLCQLLREALQQAQVMRQYVISNWPAWHASLCEDAQYVLYYALGVVPAWILCLQAAIQEASAGMTWAPGIQQMATTASYASRSITASVQQIYKALAQTQQMFQSRMATHPPLDMLAGVVHNKLATGSSSSSIARGLTHSMAAFTAADLPAPPSARQYWRERHISPAAERRAQLIGTSTVKAFAAELAAALTSSKAAASSGLQHMLVEPLQRAGFISSNGHSPTVAGVIAAASVLLAGSISRSMRRSAEAEDERLLQQVQLQMKAESLAAQRARFRRALGDAQAVTAAAAPGAASSRRRTASPMDDYDTWEDTIPAIPVAPARSLSGGAVMDPDGLPHMDGHAAREYQKFMAGAKAVDVPMWNTNMVEDLPKVSMKELQRQTQKIRAAATADERAAMEDTELGRQMVEQQLNSQLQELSGAPVGRAAREAWRKEQQQRKVQEQQAQTSKQVAGANDVKSSSEVKSRGGSDSNPFAIPVEARAKWEAEDHIYSDVKPRATTSGGWNFGFGSKKQQPRQSMPQQARRRRFADDVDRSEAVLAAEQHNNSNSVPKASVFGNVLEPPISRSPNADEQRPQQSHPAAAECAGPAEGTPEWDAQMRQEMVRSGAARRARRQQMMQQPQAEAGTGPVSVQQQEEPQQVTVMQPNPAASSRSTGPRDKAGAPQRHVLPEQSLNRPKWPGAGVPGSSSPQGGGQRMTVLGRIATGPSSTSRNDRLSIASARDVQDVTAAAEAPDSTDMQRMQAAAVFRAEAAAEARAAAVETEQQEQQLVTAGQQQDTDSGDYNPFAVDRANVLNDEEAFEMGKQVDKETRRIRLQS